MYRCMHICVTTIKKATINFEREQGRDGGEDLEAGEQRGELL